MYAKVIDASFSRISVPTFRLFRDEGYDIFVQDVWTGIGSPLPSYWNLYDSLEAKNISAAYNVINGARPGDEQIDEGHRVIGDLWNEMNFIAVDVEVNGITVEIVRQALDHVRTLGQRAILYSGGWFWADPNRWADGANDPTDFRDEKLWTSDYTKTPTLLAPGYGGWETAVGHQHKGTTFRHGVEVDLNVFDPAFIYKTEEAIMRRHVAESKWYKDAFEEGTKWGLGLWACHARKDFVAACGEKLRASDTRLTVEIIAHQVNQGGSLILLDGDKQYAAIVPADGKRHQVNLYIDDTSKGKFYLWIVGAPLRIQRVGCTEAG